MPLQRSTRKSAPMPDFEPLRIRAYLQCGVVSDRHLPLDGALYYQLVREVVGAQDLTVPGGHRYRQSLAGKRPLPFAKVENHTPHYYYAASFAQWPEHTIEGLDHWSKRADVREAIALVDFRGRRGRIVTGSGRYKAYRHPIYYRHALYVDWYARGDRAELERLLPWCTHLGKKTDQGWGAVLRWEVIPWPEDWSVRGPGGMLMRAVPDKAGDCTYGIRPSYWSARHQFRCRMPSPTPPPTAPARPSARPSRSSHPGPPPPSTRAPRGPSGP